LEEIMGKKEDIITLDELEKALGIAHKSSGEIPAGFKTAREWSKEWDTSLRTAQMRIADATDAGMVQMRKFRRKGIDGGNYYSAHYDISPKLSKNKG
jgi:hypothetical protein